MEEMGKAVEKDTFYSWFLNLKALKEACMNIGRWFFFIGNVKGSINPYFDFSGNWFLSYAKTWALVSIFTCFLPSFQNPNANVFWTPLRWRQGLHKTILQIASLVETPNVLWAPFSRTQTSGTTQRESIWLLRHDTATHRLVLQFSAAINAFWRQAWREVCYELSASI